MKPTRPIPRTPAPVAPIAVPPASAAPAGKANPPEERIAFALDADGRPDVKRMHAKTKDKLASILKDPEVARSLGVAPAPDAVPGSVLSLDLVRAFVSTLSQVNVVLVSRYTGAPAHLVLAIAPWTPDEQAAIVGPLAAVLNKYAPSALSKYGDEIALLFILGSTTANKIEAVRHAAAAARPSRVVPITEPVIDPVADTTEGQS